MYCKLCFLPSLIVKGKWQKYYRLIWKRFQNYITEVYFRVLTLALFRDIFWFDIKQLLHSVFVVCKIINVSVRVISLAELLFQVEKTMN